MHAHMSREVVAPTRSLHSIEAHTHWHTSKRPDTRNRGCSRTSPRASQRARPPLHQQHRRASSIARALAAQRRTPRRAVADAAHPRRLGRSLLPLLIAAARARRQVLLVYEEEAACAHGRVPPHLHQPQAHVSSWSSGRVAMASDRGRGIARARRGMRGVERRAHGRVYRSRIKQEGHAHDGGCSERPIVCISSRRMLSLGYLQSEV